MKYILINGNYVERFSHSLKEYGFTAVALPPEERLNKIVASHADTLIFSEGNIINESYLKKLPKDFWHHFTPSADCPHGNYPEDTVFNAMKIGEHIFFGKSVSESVVSYAKEKGLKQVTVKQGYAHCTTLAIDEKNAAITADNGMAAAMERVGISVLGITKGNIALEGAKYGFIGGASFVCREEKRVYFFGDISAHPNHAEIIDFITNLGYSALSLDGILTDIGGAVILPQDGE